MLKKKYKKIKTVKKQLLKLTYTYNCITIIKNSCDNYTCLVNSKCYVKH